jgi:hypothetical protein
MQVTPCGGDRKALAESAIEDMRGARFKQILVDGKSIKLKAIVKYIFVPL